jgi:hypothetical protein
VDAGRAQASKDQLALSNLDLSPNFKSDSDVKSEKDANVRPRTWSEFCFGSGVEAKTKTDGQSCYDKGVSVGVYQIEKDRFTRENLDLDSNFKSDSDVEPE